MAGFTISKRVHAPADVVFDVFTDLARAEQRVPGILKIEILTDGPVGKGTRWRETRRVFRREATEEMEITAFEPGRGYTVGCASCGCEYDWTYRFAPAGDATDVEFGMEIRPVTLFARLMSPLGRLMMGAMKKCTEKDFDHLKAVAESGPPSTLAATT